MPHRPPPAFDTVVSAPAEFAAYKAVFRAAHVSPWQKIEERFYLVLLYDRSKPSFSHNRD